MGPSGVFGISERRGQSLPSNYGVLKLRGLVGDPLLVGGLGPGAPAPLNPALKNMVL